MSDSTWSWLPDPTGTKAAEIETHYRNMAPGQWPKGLYRDDSQEVLDQTAVGAVFGALRKMSWWVMESYLPHKDTGAYLLSWWEDLFGLDHSGSVGKRINRIVASFRNRGTLVTEKLQAIFGPLFDTTDPETDISITGPTPSTTWQASVEWNSITWGLPLDTLNDIHGSSRLLFWAVGPSGAIYKCGVDVNGNYVWTAQTSGTANNLEGVWAPVGGTSFAWAVGDSGTVREYWPSTWGAGPVGGPGENLKAVSGTEKKRWSASHSQYIPDTIAVCGAGGRISTWNGSWTNNTVGGGGDVWQAIHAFAPDDIWACADTGKVATYNGASWTTATPAAVNWHGIRKCQDNDYVYVVGNGGNCYEHNTSSWSAVSTGHAIDMYDLSGWASDRLVAVGANGQAWRYSGPETDAWREIETPTWEKQLGVWVPKNSCFLFSAGENGSAMYSPSSNEGFARNQNQQHIYSTALDLDPDYPAGRAKTRLCAPFYQEWTLGRRKTLRWSDSGGQSGWFNSCWS
jgi:hypothetical protein